MRKFLFLAFLTGCVYSCLFSQTVTPQKGLFIRSNCQLTPGRYYLTGDPDNLQNPVINIQGNDLVVDFAGVVLYGAEQTGRPDQFAGLCIMVAGGRNITIKNLQARGYKVALMAQGVEGLQLLDCDLSYNFRQHLYSYREREDLSDWLSYHQNEKDEWLRYGAAAYLKDCPKALVRGLRVTQGQNGLMLMRCDDGLFYNNDIRFNSGIGIGLYRSSRNRFFHNKLDWNVRGYSHGFYSRGQDSAAILCYEQSSDNVFAFNSATHSGDGFFLWAGQSTMDNGQGGCNNNLLYGNDFSHSPTNGVEVTFSSNQIVNNRIEDCTYGVWGGYSWKTLIAGNKIGHCKYGVAIEHGQENTISNNHFVNMERGIWLWKRNQQPADWGYALNRDVSSRDYNIWHNAFVSIKNPLHISGTKKAIVNDDNEFYHFDQLLVEDQPNEEFFFVKNNIYLTPGAKPVPARDKNRLQLEARIADSTSFEEVLRLPDWVTSKYQLSPMADGIEALLPPDARRGRKFMLVNEWGPYNFEYPALWLSEKKNNTYTFELMGPEQGGWSVVSSQGLQQVSAVKGVFPATLTATKASGAEAVNLKIRYKGPAFTDQFGVFHPANDASFVFAYREYEPALNWSVQWFTYTEASDPIANYPAFKALSQKTPIKTETTPALAWRWWAGPFQGGPDDRFATFAQSKIEAPAGEYRLIVTSDDGIRVFVDGNMVIDHWDIHEPAVDEAVINLNGSHTISVEHFDATGLATIDVRLQLND